MSPPERRGEEGAAAPPRPERASPSARAARSRLSSTAGRAAAGERSRLSSTAGRAAAGERRGGGGSRARRRMRIQASRAFRRAVARGRPEGWPSRRVGHATLQPTRVQPLRPPLRQQKAAQGPGLRSCGGCTPGTSDS
eukprot:scaffold137246_cov187-Phaeocystis_antarctica.AAC.2